MVALGTLGELGKTRLRVGQGTDDVAELVVAGDGSGWQWTNKTDVIR